MTEYSVGDHLAQSLFGQAHSFRCDVCGLETEVTTGALHWMRWMLHDLTVGWNRAHWSTYSWEVR